MGGLETAREEEGRGGEGRGGEERGGEERRGGDGNVPTFLRSAVPLRDVEATFHSLSVSDLNWTSYSAAPSAASYDIVMPSPSARTRAGASILETPLVSVSKSHVSPKLPQSLLRIFRHCRTRGRVRVTDETDRQEEEEEEEEEENGSVGGRGLGGWVVCSRGGGHEGIAPVDPCPRPRQVLCPAREILLAHHGTLETVGERHPVASFWL